MSTAGSRSAYVLTEAVLAAGLPAGVFNLVSGRGSVVGEALAAHRLVDVVSFPYGPPCVLPPDPGPYKS